MRIDIQIPAHLRKQVAADFFLPILEGGELFAEVQATMAALTFILEKLAGNLLALRQLLYPALEFRTLHHLIFGHICPSVKRRNECDLLAGHSGADSRSRSRLENAGN